MVTFILPGYSAHNKDWADEVAKNLKIGGDKRPVYWEHWTDPEKRLRPKEKAQDIADILRGDSVNIIAKSVGTLVAAYVVKSIPKQVNKIILCGIPSTSTERLKIFQEAFSGFPADRVVCFQNDKDPFKTSSEIKQFMGKVNSKIRVNSMPRNDHKYPYYGEFNKFLNS